MLCRFAMTLAMSLALVPAARYEEMQARLKEFEDVVLIPFVDTRNMTDAEAIEALTSGKNKR
jgi:hypothetical protein